MTRNRTVNGRRQRSGDGSIYEYKGKVYARLQCIGQDGKRKDRKIPANDRKHARELLRELRANMHTRGEDALDARRMTFQQLAAVYSQCKFFPAVYRDGKKVAGLRSYAHTKSFLPTLVKYFGRRRLRTIKHSDLEAFKFERLETITIQGRERTIASVNRELELLRSMLRYAQREGWIVKSPFESGTSLISKAGEVKRERILTIEEEAVMLAACIGRLAHLKPLLIAALDTAMRRGELFQLEWTDVNLEDGLIRIRATTTKTEIARTVGITARLRVELEHLRELQSRDYKGRVFGIADNVKKAFTSLRRATGLLDFRFHDARHTAITRMVQSGMPAPEIMKISGHKQFSTFLRYVNVNDQAAKRGAEHLTQYLDTLSIEQNLSESIN